VSSKWVNRNVHPGKAQQADPGSESGAYRREYVHKRSSRSSKNDNGKRKSRRRHRFRLRLRFANRLSALASLLVCILTIAALVAYLRSHSTDAPTKKWITESERVLAPDSGPDPIIHNPSATVEKFLAATSVADLAKLSRVDDNSPILLRDHGKEILAWNKAHAKWKGLYEAKANGLNFAAFVVQHATEPKRHAYVVQTTFGPRIDIGAYLGWCSADWDSLATGKATRASTLRAFASRIHYYNFRYTDDKAWQSYRLAPLSGTTSLYGYVARNSNASRILDIMIRDKRSFPVIVSLEDGEAGSTHRQFRISHVLAADWISSPDVIEDNISLLTEKLAFHPLSAPATDGAPTDGQDNHEDH